MWQILRARRFSAFKFRRQVPFKNFILDFVCFEKRIVIELDGGQHAESKSDIERDRCLRGEGFETLRYWNDDVLKRRLSVLEDIWNRLNRRTVYPSPGASLRSAPPSPTRGEGKKA